MYLFDNSQSGALERLLGLQRIEDATSIAALERLPSLEGSRCLEIGAGAGSIAAWLAGRAGPEGRVIATDIDTSHLDASRYEVLRHDVMREELPEVDFDLVHVRHVLIHLPDPRAALQKMLRRMRPGAYLIAEESDLRTWRSAMAPGAERIPGFDAGVSKVLQVYASRGMDVALGATLPGLLIDLGLSIIDERSACRTVCGGSAEAAYQQMSVVHLARAARVRDSAAAAALENFARCFEDPAVRYHSRTTVTVTARRVI